MTPRRSALALLTGALLLLPLSGAAQLLRVSGTGTALGTMRRLAGPFAKANPGLRLQPLESIGSSGAFRAVADGALELGLAARPLKAQEIGMGLVALPYARTPFLFAVGPRADVRDFTLGDAIRLYRGELTRWPNGERIRLVLRPRADVDTQILRSIAASLSEAVDSALAREGMLVAVTNQDSNAMLVRTPGAIGLSSLTQIVTEGLSVTPLSWNGVAPTLKNLESGAYPLAKTLYLVIKAPASPAVRRFVAFLSSPEARRILADSGNVAIALPPLE